MQHIDNLFSEAFELYSTGKYSESILKLTYAGDLIKNKGNDDFLSSIENLRGFNYMEIGDKEMARECFVKALNINPSSSQACVGLAQLFIIDCKYNEAKTMYEWGIRNNPANTVAVDGLAKVNKILNLPEDDNSLFKSDENMEDVKNTDSDLNADNLIEEAYELFNNKEFRNALNKLTQAESIFNGQLTSPTNVEFAASFYNMKGFNYLGLNDIDNAKACFQKAIEINPNSSQAYAGLGEILFLNNYDEQAKIMFEKAVENNPDNLFAVAGLKKVKGFLNEKSNENNELKLSSNDNLKIFHRDDFGKLFNQLGLYGNGAEIGVQAGTYSQILRNTWKGEELYLIDCWKHKNDYNDIANIPDEKHQELYLSVIKKFIDDRSVQIIRKDSVEAAKQFPDEFFDWIYLDADHSFEGSSKDINAWWPKLKKGGIFAGHDYIDGEYTVGNFGVKSSVNNFINSNKGIKLYTTEEETWKSWYFIKPGQTETEIKTGDKNINEIDSQKLEPVLNDILTASYELFNLKHFEDAINTLDESEELFYSQNNKDLISAYENMKGFNFLGLDNKDKARKSFETALNINSESSQACAGLGELFFLEGKDNEAQTMYEYAVKNNPENQFAVAGLEKVNKVLKLS